MKKPRLVLLTRTFPFGFGEEFLETEIPYLAERFTVDIIPTSCTKVSVERRRVTPVGVRVRDDIAATYKEHTTQRVAWVRQHPKAIVRALTLLWNERFHISSSLRSSKRFLYSMFQALVLQRVLMKHYQPDEVAVYYSYWLDYSAFSLALLRREVSSVVLSRTHRVDLYRCARPDHYQPAQEQMVNGLDWVICVSEHGLEYLRLMYPTASGKLYLSRLGVPKADDVNTPSKDGRLRIVSCSYLTPVKRIHLIVEAIAQTSLPIVWTHLGGGPCESLLRQQATELPEHVEWRITGKIANREVLEFYHTHPVDLFLNVSASEGLPVSIMEAMSYGIPVAATEVGGSSELVTADNGYLWPANVTPKRIATTLEHFYALSPAEKWKVRSSSYATWKYKVNASVQYRTFSAWLVQVSSTIGSLRKGGPDATSPLGIASHLPPRMSS